jgi:hypothetical protein
MAGALVPESILRELAGLWVSLGEQGRAESGAGVLRACTMTLVVLAEESEDAASLGETIAALMPEHPSRAIVIRLRGPGGHELSARVFAQCWMPFGQRRQICCEQIEITASDEALRDLPSVVLPLGAPDLPLVLWCRDMRLAAMPEFRPLAAMARKVVLNSTEPAHLRLLAEEAARGTILGDLAWTRLTRWRAMLSQVFDNRVYQQALPRISSVRVTYGDALETAGWYMGAWISGALVGAGARPALNVARQPGLAALTLELAGEGLRVSLARQEDRLIVTVNGGSTCANLPQPTDYLLMREELGILQRDSVFENTLVSAARLA